MIDLHGLLPTLRREVHRGGRMTLITGAVALLAIAAATRLEGSVAMVPGGLALLGAVFAWFGPMVHLGADRLLGHLEFDRTLPIALRVMATGRLLGASIRILPLLPALVALLLGFHRLDGHEGSANLALLIGIPLIGQLFATVVLWWVMALNARWSFRKLWWVPTTIGFLPQLSIMLLPDALRRWIGDWVVGAFESVSHWAASPAALVLLLLVVLPLLIACFAGAAMLFASGLARYQFDPTQLGVPVSRAGRVELSALGRGPLLAVARLRLRLATEQFRRELLLLLILFLVAAFGPEGAREFATHYIPVLAALLPAGITLQLMSGRVTGDLEGMQQLPHAASTIGLGYLVAIAVMALPGAVMLQVLHALSGTTPTLLSITSSWAWFVAIAWSGAAVGLWFRRRYVLVLLGLLLIVVVAKAFLDPEDRIVATLVMLFDGFRTFRASAGPVLPFAVSLFTVVVGVPLFARGLARYSHQKA